MSTVLRKVFLILIVFGVVIFLTNFSSFAFDYRRLPPEIAINLTHSNNYVNGQLSAPYTVKWNSRVYSSSRSYNDTLQPSPPGFVAKFALDNDEKSDDGFYWYASKGALAGISYKNEDIKNLPPGLVIGLTSRQDKYSNNFVWYKEGEFKGYYCINAIKNEPYSNLVPFYGGKGSEKSNGLYWYEIRENQIYDYRNFLKDAPSGFVFGLKHSVNQKQKTFFWDGVYYDPVQSFIRPKDYPTPKGFVARFGRDIGAGVGEGYFWYETTGEFYRESVSKSFASIVSDYSSYDYDNDGLNEINKLTYLKRENDKYQIDEDLDPFILVFVEARLFNFIPGAMYTGENILERLDILTYDMALGNKTPKGVKIIIADVYGGTEHQDGKTVLSMRELFRDIKKYYPNFAGVIMVGRFPETLLVRRAFWKHEKREWQINGITYPNADQPYWIGLEPEIIAERTDLILGDLDGKWENLYTENSTLLSHYVVAADINDGYLQRFIPSEYNSSALTFRDFFFIDDVFIEEKSDGTLIVNYYGGDYNEEFTKGNKLLNPEVSVFDWCKKYPIAKQEISISRINASYVSLVARDTIEDSSGNGLIDSNGNPQSITVTPPASYDIFLHSDDLERRLIIDYFDRNHAYRWGLHTDDANKLAMTNGSNMSPAYPKNDIKKYFGLEVITYSNANLVDYVKFLQDPAKIKIIEAHSTSRSSTFNNTHTTADLEKIAGAGLRPYRWLIENDKTYVPSFAGLEGSTDYTLYHTLWRGHVNINSGPTIYFHSGCYANSPPNAASLPYNNLHYGRCQNAESILFYGNGVSLIARAKEFNDFVCSETFESLGNNQTIGKSLELYREHDSFDDTYGKHDIATKRTYTWSILGDWSLRKDPYTVENSQIGDNYVQIYTGNHFTGESIKLPRGYYNLNQLKNTIGNDQVSSIKTNGLKVEIFKENNFSGGKKTITSDQSLLYSFNNSISSLIVK